MVAGRSRRLTMSSPASQSPAESATNPTESLTDPLEFAAALSRSFAQTQDINATVREALAQIVKLLRVEAGAIFLLDEVKANLICRASVGPVDVTGLSVPNGSGIVGRAVVEDRIQVVEQAYQDQQFFAEADRKTGFVTRSILCAPMSVAQTVIGAVEVLNKQNGKPFNAKDQNLLRVMAASSALAISNARRPPGGAGAPAARGRAGRRDPASPAAHGRRRDVADLRPGTADPGSVRRFL
jgi:sigma-B regulation protein RsbU (phosphoserine phosphatase)